MRCYFNLVSSHHTITDAEGLEVADVGAGLVLPRCTTDGMTLHLNEIAQAVAPRPSQASVRSGKVWLE